MNPTYDIIVIGGGPGGYVAAIRAAQLGYKTACVEAAATLGGTCLNVGCIPSKALLESTAFYEKIQYDSAAHGIGTGTATLDVPTMIARKDDIVKQLTGGIAQLFKANGIDWLQGRGQLLANKTVAITAEDGSVSQTQATKAVILAVGSVPVDIPVAKMDGPHIISSNEALSLTTSASSAQASSASNSAASGVPPVQKSPSSKPWTTSCQWPTANSRAKRKNTSKNRASTSASAPKSAKPKCKAAK